jgi:hypothetical protein
VNALEAGAGDLGDRRLGGRAQLDGAVDVVCQDELADLFIVSGVAITKGDGTVSVEAHPGPRCERCWKHFDALAADPPDVCARCAEALKVKS